MWKIILDSNSKLGFIIFTALYLSNFITDTAADDGCGGFIEVTTSPFTIATRNHYGYSTYEAYSNCIWVMEASGGNQVSLTISSFVGDMFGTECRDYITVTDGPTSDNTLLDKNCTTLSNVVINSTARWMMVQFKADGATFTSGFMATVSAVKAATDISTYDTTIQDCNSHMYLCSNKICVVRAYICDGFNDCGCTNECDESSCDGIGLSAADNIGIGVGIGGFIFIVIFLVVHFIERHRKKKALMQEEETDRQIRNSKKKGGGKEKDTKDKKDAKGKNRKVVPKKEKESKVHWV